MKLMTERIGGLFGERPIALGTVLLLTSRERRTLESASKIACKGRELLRQRYGDVEADGFDLDTELASVEHGCAELAEQGKAVVR